MRNQPPIQTVYQLGVTLVEMVVVIVVLGIALTAVTQIIGQNTISGAYTYDETKAIELAQSYIGEIKSKRYDESSPINGVPPCDAPSAAACTAAGSFGSETGEDTRAAFDDVDDFHNLNETGSALKDISGEPREGYENFRVQAVVTYSGNIPPRSGTTASDAKKVILTVTQPNGETLDFSFHRANF